MAISYSPVLMRRQCSVVVLTTILSIALGPLFADARDLSFSQLSLVRDGPAEDAEDPAADESDEADDDDAGDWGAPPIIGDYNPGSTVLWDGSSRIPTWVSTFIALLWVTMVCSFPVIIIKLEGNSITKAQISLFVTMWFAFLGGIYLFTQIILFQSIHFKRIRSLTIVEAVYFLSQVLTTVGYGDITPAKPRGQVFVGIYVLFSLFVIATVLSEASDLIARTTKKYVDLYNARWHGLATPRKEEESQIEIGDDGAVAVSAFQDVPPPLAYGNLLKAVGVYTGCVLVGIAFFTLYPGENKTLFQAIYMSIITLSTVGFGAFTPVTEAGLVFSAFWMLFGSMALISVVGCFTQFHEQIKIRERWNPNTMEEMKRQFVTGLPSEPEKLDLLKQYLLQKALMSQNEMDAVVAFCNKMGPDKSGKLSKAVLEDFWAVDSSAATV